MFLITHDQWGSAVPLAIIKAATPKEAIEVFKMNTTEGTLIYASADNEEEDEDYFTAMPIDTDAVYTWIGALS